MKMKGVVVFLAVVFFLVVVPVDIEHGSLSAWQTELRAQHVPVPPAGPITSKGIPPGPPGPPPGHPGPPGPTGPPGPPGPGKPVPEPSMLILLGIGLAAGGAYSFVRRQKNKERV